MKLSAKLKKELKQCFKEGLKHRATAEYLNELGYKTLQNREWTTHTVSQQLIAMGLRKTKPYTCPNKRKKKEPVQTEMNLITESFAARMTAIDRALSEWEGKLGL